MIYLDLDGVCVNLHDQVLRVWGKPNPYTDLPRGKHPWLREVWGMTEAEFWKPIDALGVEFFATLPPYPWFEALHRELSKLAPVTFLTSPGFALHAPTGKAMWLRRWFGSGFDNFVITRRKHMLAKPGTVLIDDDDFWCEEFAKAGGAVVTFPQKWNDGEPILDGEDVVKVICQRVVTALALDPGAASVKSPAAALRETPMPSLRPGMPVTLSWNPVFAQDPMNFQGTIAAMEPESGTVAIVAKHARRTGSGTVEAEHREVQWDPHHAIWFLLDAEGKRALDTCMVQLTSP